MKRQVVHRISRYCPSFTPCGLLVESVKARTADTYSDDVCKRCRDSLKPHIQDPLLPGKGALNLENR